jgi:hypothetical protein
MPIDVALGTASLWCRDGLDTDGLDTAGESEPYIWLIFFKFDGSCVTVNSSFTELEGAPVFHIGAGCQENISSGIRNGEEQPIPVDVGLWETTLQPITVGPEKIPGVIGVLGLLLEEHDTPNSDMEAAKKVFVEFVEEQLGRILPVNVATLSAEVTELKTQDGNLTAAEAQEKVLQNLFAPAEKELHKWTEDILAGVVVKAAGLGGEIVNAIDPDEVYCSFHETFSEQRLAAAAVAEPPEGSEYGRIEMELVPSSSEEQEGRRFLMILRGSAWQQIRWIGTPVPEGVAHGRWRVTGVLQEWSVEKNHLWISVIGGTLADGTPWWLTRDTAVKRIEDSVNSFFVKGADGSEADVIVSQANDVGHRYLTTVADASKEDNLTALPPCAQGVWHSESTVGSGWE